jgi:GAF domain-containing protein
VIGVLELLDKEGAPSFDEDDIRLLSLFANQAAIAIEQSRVQQSAGALVASVMRSVVAGGESAGTDEALERDIREFGASFEQDELFRHSLRLADLVQEITRAGEREVDACEQILEGFAAYLRARSPAV